MTIEEIKTAAASSPDLVKQLVSSFKDQFVVGAHAEGLVVRTTQQDADFLKAKIDAELPGKVEEKFNSKFKETLDAQDALVAETTGLQKGPHEKSSEFLKRAMTEMKSKGGDHATKDKVAQLEKVIADNAAAHQAEIAKRDTTLLNHMVGADVDNALSSRQFFVPPHLKTDAEKQAFITQQRQLLKAGLLGQVTAKVDAEGKLSYYEQDKPILSTTDGKPLGAGDLIGQRFSAYFIQSGQQGSGSGTGQPTGAAGTGIKNKEDIHKHLAASGVVAGTKEYLNQLEKIAKDNSISI